MWHVLQGSADRVMIVTPLVLLVTLFALAALLALASRLHLVDYPSGRKAHAAPTPVVGGLAIVIGAAPFALLLLPLTTQLKGFFIAAAILVGSGVVDDICGMRWQFRVVAQLASALALVCLGGVQIHHLGTVFGFPAHELGALAVPLSLVATVGIINAVNMIDGVDGLAGSVGVVSLGMLAGAAAYAGNGRLADGLVILIGALCAFLLLNLRTPWNPRAQLFLGNAGSEFLGLVVACACFRLTQNEHHPVGPQIAPFLIAPPLIDCLTLIVCRLRRRQSPFVGDRSHIHHLLLDAGFSATGVVAVIAGGTLAIGAGAALALKAHAPAPAFTLVFVGLLVGHFLWTRHRERAVAGLAALRRWRPIPAPAPSVLEASPVELLPERPPRWPWTYRPELAWAEEGDGPFLADHPHRIRDSHLQL